MTTYTTRLQKGDQFAIDSYGHTGRIYTVKGFAPCKVGIKYAVCEWSDAPGDTVLFSASDLNEYGADFRLFDTSQRETDAEYFERMESRIITNPLEGRYSEESKRRFREQIFANRETGVAV